MPVPQVSYETASSSGSMFSKAAFIADGNEVDLDDPEFWSKILPEMQVRRMALHASWAHSPAR